MKVKEHIKILKTLDPEEEIFANWWREDTVGYLVKNLETPWEEICRIMDKKYPWDDFTEELHTYLYYYIEDSKNPDISDLKFEATW
jgi:hypothetical protein